MLRFLGAAFMLLLPLIILDIVMTAIFVYLGLNPDDGVEFLKQAKELAEGHVIALNTYGRDFYVWLGFAGETAIPLAKWTALGIILLSYVPVAATGYFTWRYEIRTYKKVRELWKAWRSGSQ